MIVLMKYTVRQLLRKVKSCFLTLLRLVARTRDFHSLNMGSIPVGVIQNYFLLEGAVQVSVNYARREKGYA